MGGPGSGRNNRNSLKTHCPWGHPLDGQLTTDYGGKKRYCKTCKAKANARYQAKRKQETQANA